MPSWPQPRPPEDSGDPVGVAVPSGLWPTACGCWARPSTGQVVVAGQRGLSVKGCLVREVAAPPGEGSVNLTQWNAVRIPGPPPANQAVTLSQLEG